VSSGAEQIERMRVAWVDTDAGGRIHFSNAFRWAEVAETSLMRRVGMLDGWGDFPRKHVEAEFHQVLRFDDEFEVRLPERNDRTVALSGGWNTVFSRRTMKDQSQGPLSRQALSSGAFFLEGEIAAKGWSARAQGFYGGEAQGASVDLSRVVKAGNEVSYGIAMHVGGLRNDWLPDGRRTALMEKTAYSVSVGPSIMLRGITASTQFGLLTNGQEALQVMATRLSANGRLTSVRIPVSVTAEKTFAFGGGPIVSRRRDALERISASVHVLESFALNFGMSSHFIAWPGEQPSLDFRASEVLMTVGARYTLTW